MFLFSHIYGIIYAIRHRGDEVMDFKKYLEKFNIKKLEHAEAFLKTLQYNHVTTVPYENLDLVNGKLLVLTPEAVYQKIIEGRRGGYCFELNCLLSAFLKANGFEVRDFLGRFLRGEEGVPMRRHRVAEVSLGEKRYIMDVGMGQAGPRHPLILEENLVQEQFGESYRFAFEDGLGWVLYSLVKGEWERLYCFTEERQYEIDFEAPSFFCERHPSSKFNKAPMVAIKTTDGRKTINGNDFKVFSADELVHIEENMTDERFYEVLDKEFNIDWRKNNA